MTSSTRRDAYKPHGRWCSSCCRDDVHNVGEHARVLLASDRYVRGTTRALLMTRPDSPPPELVVAQTAHARRVGRSARARPPADSTLATLLARRGKTAIGTAMGALRRRAVLCGATPHEEVRRDHPVACLGRRRPLDAELSRFTEPVAQSMPANWLDVRALNPYDPSLDRHCARASRAASSSALAAGNSFP